jgi:hypothetical protein
MDYPEIERIEDGDTASECIFTGKAVMHHDYREGVLVLFNARLKVLFETEEICSQFASAENKLIRVQANAPSNGYYTITRIFDFVYRKQAVSFAKQDAAFHRTRIAVLKRQQRELEADLKVAGDDRSLQRTILAEIEVICDQMSFHQEQANKSIPCFNCSKPATLISWGLGLLFWQVSEKDSSCEGSFDRASCRRQVVSVFTSSHVQTTLLAQERAARLRATVGQTTARNRAFGRLLSLLQQHPRVRPNWRRRQTTLRATGEASHYKRV